MSPKIEIVRGSLLDQDVEAIVNAANTSMRGGGGIDGAIHRAAGPSLLMELVERAPHGAKIGQVVVTRGHNTRFSHILHVPGPFWSGGNNNEERDLQACYRNAALKAGELGMSSVGFCSISTGIFRFPIEIAAPLALATVKEATAGNLVERVVFAMFGQAEFEAFANAWQTQLESSQ